MSASWDNTIGIWETRTWKLKQRLDHHKNFLKSLTSIDVYDQIKRTDITYFLVAGSTHMVKIYNPYKNFECI